MESDLPLLGRRAELGADCEIGPVTLGLKTRVDLGFFTDVESAESSRAFVGIGFKEMRLATRSFFVLAEALDLKNI